MRKLDGRTQYIGCTATAEEGALLYARELGTEASAAAAAAAAGAAAESMTVAEAEQAATAEGLTLVRSSRSRSGFEGVYLLRENPLGPGRQHTRLDFMAGRPGPGVRGRVGGGAARGV